MVFSYQKRGEVEYWKPKQHGKLTVAAVSRGNLGKVSVVVSLHLQVEYLGLGIARFRDQVLVQEILKSVK